MQSTEVEQYIQLLEHYDEAGDLETPVGFTTDDYYALRDEITQFIVDLEKLDLRLNVKRYDAQDAACICRLNIYLRKEEPKSENLELGLIFSFFGKMVAVSEYDGYSLGQEFIGRVEALLAAHGFRVIPQEILNQPYTGKRGHYKARNHSWLIRFFSEV